MNESINVEFLGKNHPVFDYNPVLVNLYQFLIKEIGQKSYLV